MDRSADDDTIDYTATADAAWREYESERLARDQDPVPGLHYGGIVQRDSIPALLEPGGVFLTKRQVQILEGLMPG